MPDQSEIHLCIMGKPDSVRQVKMLFSDEKGNFNPHKALAADDVLNLVPSYVKPEKGQSIINYKEKMHEEYIRVAAQSSPHEQFRLHHGIAMNQADFPDSICIDKEICFFTRTWSPPIQEFISFSILYRNVAFAMDFDSSWLTHAGAVYISRGDVWYHNYRMKSKDIDGFDIGLDANFDFRYKTKHQKLGMLVPPNKLPGIDRIFKRADPEEMGDTCSFFPHYDFENDGDPDDEHIPDNYIPNLYEPSEIEIRKYWDEKLAEIIMMDRKTIFQSFNTKTWTN